MKTLRTLIQDYIGMMPKDKGCKNWSEMQSKMEEDINQFYADRSTPPRNELQQNDIDSIIKSINNVEWDNEGNPLYSQAQLIQAMQDNPAQSWVNDIEETIEPGPPTLEQFKKDCEEWIPNDFARAMFIDRYKGLFAQPKDTPKQGDLVSLINDKLNLIHSDTRCTDFDNGFVAGAIAVGYATPNPAQSWVKVEDRVPEVKGHAGTYKSSDPVLITVKYSSHLMIAIFQTGVSNDNKWQQWLLTDGCVISDVTHWMPLPSAPGTPTSNGSTHRQP